MTKIDELNHSLHQSQTVAIQLNTQLQSVYSSLSWRITWPLRKSLDLLSSLPRLGKRIISDLRSRTSLFVRAVRTRMPGRSSTDISTTTQPLSRQVPLKKDVQNLKNRPTILFLSTYPFVEPRHGGQVRLANIARTFDVAGWQVESLAVYEPESFAMLPLGSRDIPFPTGTAYRQFQGRNIPLINDLLAGQYAVAPDGRYKEVLKRLPTHIDTIWVEQPWLWLLAAKIKQSQAYENICLIYGSQNIEAPLKHDILHSYNIVDADDAIVVIDELEQQAAREADISIAVTESDLNTLIKWGAKRPLLAPNGIEHYEADPELLNSWKARLPKAPWLLYVASAHPPNFQAFTQCIGESLGCIPPDSRLVVVGSVCEHLYLQLASTRFHSLNLSRLELLFSLPNNDLAAVKTLAHAFLLPIPHGGGSNIKTAEALYSGAYVIGTEAAFRGFENFLDLPEVIVARNPSQFQLAIRDVLARPKALRKDAAEPTKRREDLLWDNCLASIPTVVTDMMKGGRHK